MITIECPLTQHSVELLKAGDSVEINGVIYAARDAAHKRIIDMINKGQELPFELKNSIIYYVGPCPSRSDEVIGSAGPTTSSRMDAYAPKLIELGLTGMIGKGLRNQEVITAMKQYKAVYFGAIGGAGALISRTIKSQEVIAFPELGPEALRKLTVVKFPAVVIIDCHGNNIYEFGKAKYRIKR